MGWDAHRLRGFFFCLTRKASKVHCAPRYWALCFATGIGVDRYGLRVVIMDYVSLQSGPIH